MLSLLDIEELTSIIRGKALQIKMKNKLQILVTVIFLAFVAWWISFQHVVTKQGTSVQWFGGTYGSVALIGAVIGFAAAKKWGGFKTVLGRALTLFSLSLLAQEAGQLIYTYYIYGAKIQIPYPSWGDVAYFGSVLFYIAAAFFLARAAGVKYSLKQKKSYKFIATVLPLVLLVASYSILLHNHHYDTSKPLTVFLDVGYPVGEAIYISIAIVAFLLSRKALGGMLRPAILLVLLALVIQYISDFTFVYQSSRGTYLSGKFADLFYLIAYFAMTTALIRFHVAYKHIQNRPGLPVNSAPPLQTTNKVDV
ncbi:MAG TPA: hypothetical protein VLG27_03780 [Candidatus Saccharimonadia bacterium]|nr:hypothetical protein [Candidatus Saccharimonadia bacterium]